MGIGLHNYEDQEAQDPPSATWWTRKSCGAIQFKPEGLRTRRVNSVSPNPSLNALEPGEQYQRAGEDGCLVSSKKRKFTFPLPFCSIQALIKLDDAHLHWAGYSSLLSLSIQTLFSSGNTLTDTLER